MNHINNLLATTPVVPIVTIPSARDAIPTARALSLGGINTYILSLKSAASFEAIKVIRENLPKATIGAGTIMNREQLAHAKQAGAHFAISPGITPTLISAAKIIDMPLIPGVVTPSEVMDAQVMGFETLCFFPAEHFGGTKTLELYANSFPNMRFFAIGGITRTNMQDYLSLNNVIGVGGEWIAPTKLIHEQDWSDISTLARESRTNLTTRNGK